MSWPVKDLPGPIIIDFKDGVVDFQAGLPPRDNASIHYKIGFARAKQYWFDPELYPNPQ